ncbi:hypothetical protein EZV62_018320 [Acer yangbiense]|uniref:Uncharacterized protein n=1 Tax=Acer yangbiense TaxID=1000413 RepID=A0A5C7HJ23_9ROSI|nr:hypothetical protein EZV62_018320 [Acer yangbiense]
MAESEIVKLYENLSLADEDGEIHEMSEEDQKDGVVDVDLYLVGKVLSRGKKSDLAMRIGHVSKECSDEVAKVEALKGDSSKYSSWMRASIPDRQQIRLNHYKEGISMVQSSLLKERREVNEEGQQNSRSESMISQLEILTDSVMESKKKKLGPPVEPKADNNKKLIVVDDVYIGPGLIASGSCANEFRSIGISARPLLEKELNEELAMVCSTKSDMQTSPKRANTRN